MPATDVATAILPGLSPICGRQIEARFDDALMSSDDGLLVLREVEQRLVLPRRSKIRPLGQAVSFFWGRLGMFGEYRRAVQFSLRHLVRQGVMRVERIAARAHWSIENSLHRVFDITFDEDRARNRKDNAPENLATLCKLALNMLKRARPGISIRRKRKRSGWSNDFARSILSQMR